MTCYSVQPRDQKFVKGYGFLFFAENMGKNTDKNWSKNFSGKYSQKLLYHAKQSATDARKTTSKTVIRKTAEATDDSIGNKIVDKIKKVSRTSPQNSLETVANEAENIELDREMPKERYTQEEEMVFPVLSWK